MKKLAATLMLTAVFGIAGSKEREWQTGTLLDSVNNHYFAANTANERINATATFNGMSVNQNTPGGSGMESIVDNYVVETENYAYLVERTRLKSARAAALTRYHMVKFAVEKNKIFLIDDEGKEYQARIVKQFERKAPAPIQAKSQQ